MAKMSGKLRHRGIQMILASSWARLAILVAGKGRGGMFLFLLFLCFHSCSSSSLSLSFILSTISSISPDSVAQLDAPSDWRLGGRESTPAEVGNILLCRLIMKYFLRSFSPFR